MLFRSHTFYLGYAYYWNGVTYQNKCKETTEGSGKVVANFRKANELLDSLKKMEKSVPSELVNEYKDLDKDAKERLKRAEDQNNKLYHDSIPNNIDGPIPMPFGIPISIENDLKRPYDGQDIIARMVPPGVRMLEDEYKNEVGGIMGRTFEIGKEADLAQTTFLSKHNLPSALHAVSGEQNIPEDLWEKIRQCKEKGGIAGLMKTLESVNTLADNNKSTIDTLIQQMKQEEDDDQSMRTKYGTLWTRSPSNVEGKAIYDQLNYYKEKHAQGITADNKVKEMIESNKSLLELLELEKDAFNR